MYFLLWLSIAVYFGLLSAWNVRWAAGMPGWGFRWLAVSVHGALLLTLAVILGVAVWIGEFGFTGPIQEDVFIRRVPWQIFYLSQSVEGYFWPYVVLALSICVAHGVLSLWGLRKQNGQLQGANWSQGRLLVAAIVCAAFGATVFRMIESHLAAELKSEHAYSQKLQEEMFAHDIPDSENAWEPYYALYRDHRLTDVPKGLRRWAAKDERVLLTDAVAIQYARDIRPTVEKLCSLSKIPHCRCPSNRNNATTDVSFPFDSFAYVLFLDSQIQGSQNHVEEAVEDILAIQRMAAQLSQTPTSECYLRAMCVEIVAYSAIDSLMQMHVLSAVDIERLSINRVRDRNLGMAKCLEVKVNDLRGKAVEVYTEAGLFDRSHGFARIFLAKHDLVALQRAKQFCEGAVAQPSWTLLNETNNHGAMRALRFPNLTGSAPHTIPEIMRAMIHTEAEVRLSHLGMAAYRFALHKGHFPKSLEELQRLDPQLETIDPCNGEPLQMVKAGDRVTFYSVGINQRPDRDVPKPSFYYVEKDPQFTVLLPPSAK